ncbi:hypothetical protein LB518_16910 [Mesorhizobium sp. BR1-1-16]|uniref:hypothetical protein n=1 Tax=Mesorhizobium sp. BR1-1-16 TaxID=2876653 RepID=UPI001CCF5F16|nr:hypothetical protein [Mesorhizobium sp. BR1-1-16]MBZ9937981.1 hypothetical protein [Mesorhizobium sp. BR1-1-16]
MAELPFAVDQGVLELTDVVPTFNESVNVTPFATVGVGSRVFIELLRWWVAGLAGSVLGAMWNSLSSTALVWKNRP